MADIQRLPGRPQIRQVNGLVTGVITCPYCAYTFQHAPPLPRIVQCRTCGGEMDLGSLASQANKAWGRALAEASKYEIRVEDIVYVRDELPDEEKLLGDE